MAHFDFNKVTPFVGIHVGEYLKDELNARGMQQKELANLTGIQASILNDIVKGRRNLTAEQSILIGNALDIDEGFYYNLQMQYEMDRARLSERVTRQVAIIIQHRSSRNTATPPLALGQNASSPFLPNSTTP